jgi:[ribosomal protein S5]-alanine N-acetyltransferase
MMPELQTDRLILRPFTPDDLAFLVALHQEPEVVRYFGGKPWPEAMTRQWFEETLGFYRDLDAGQLAVVRTSDQRLIGRCGLTPFYVTWEPDLVCRHAASYWPDAGESATLELGYTLTRDAWGQGFATEAAARLRDHAFADRELPRLLAFIDPENAPSLRVAARLGFGRHRDARVLFGARPHWHALDVKVACFQLGREEWARTRTEDGPPAPP